MVGLLCSRWESPGSLGGGRDPSDVFSFFFASDRDPAFPPVGDLGSLEPFIPCRPCAFGPRSSLWPRITHLLFMGSCSRRLVLGQPAELCVWPAGGLAGRCRGEGQGRSCSPEPGVQWSGTLHVGHCHVGSLKWVAAGSWHQISVWAVGAGGGSRLAVHRLPALPCLGPGPLPLERCLAGSFPELWCLFPNSLCASAGQVEGLGA